MELDDACSFRTSSCVLSLQPFPPLEWPHQHHKQRKPILQYMCIENHPRGGEHTTAIHTLTAFTHIVCDSMHACV